MALRWPLETHFELFWALVAKWLSDSLWRHSLSYSGVWWPNSSREAHFELFWALVAKLLSDGLWRLILSYSELWWPNGSQMASGGSF